MSYAFSKKVDYSFDTAIDKVTDELQKEGFGVLHQTDIQATLKKKIGVDVARYQILGACNPGFAHQALQLEPNIGTMLPCNVIVREEAGAVIVSAIDPKASMMAVENESLLELADEVRGSLRKVIDRL